MISKIGLKYLGGTRIKSRVTAVPHILLLKRRGPCEPAVVALRLRSGRTRDPSELIETKREVYVGVERREFQEWTTLAPLKGASRGKPGRTGTRGPVVDPLAGLEEHGSIADNSSIYGS